MLTIQTFLSHKINRKFDCDSQCIIYLFSCKACGLQYVGSTVERFHFRWNNYKNCQREAAQGGTPPQSFFHQHFLSEGHHPRHVNLRRVKTCHFS